ncbi:MAG: hypothetical protein ACRCV9_07550 [Burkholderiaceae bacterium]
MDIIITIIVCVSLFVGALRRARAKPEGKTAKLVQIASGGGSGTPK